MRIPTFLRWLLTPLTALWLLFRPRREAPPVQVEPVVEDEREEEQAMRGHSDRRIPLDPRCPKCAALLQPVDWAFIEKMQNGGLMAQMLPKRLPGDHSHRVFAEEFPVEPSGFIEPPKRRAFEIEQIPDAQLGDEEMTILHGDAWLLKQKPAVEKPVDTHEEK
jgi:hypothetical protein